MPWRIRRQREVHSIIVEMRSNYILGCFSAAEHEYNVQKDLGAPRGATPSGRRRLQGLDSIIAEMRSNLLLGNFRGR